MLKRISLPIIAISTLLASCSKLPIDAGFPGIQVNHSGDSVTFAVIGDYGQDSPKEGEVAQMVKSWNPDFIITVGDNNYPLGTAGTIKNNVGKYYGDYIYNPDAPADRICTGKAAQEKINRFFPSPGNHDNYSIPAIRPYLDYFTLPGDERNYEFVWGPAHFFSLDGGKSGRTNSVAKNWLQSELAKAQEPFKLVYFHQPPYSPGPHGSATGMQLPFSEWGVDAVLAGHEHFYVHLTDNTSAKPLYLIIGNSGNENLYNCTANPLDPNRFTVNYCDNSHFGAILVTATKTKMVFKYYTTDQPSYPSDISVINK